MNSQGIYDYKQEYLTPKKTNMTLEEFLESDLEGYEYLNGELIPLAPTSVEHGYISVNLSSLLHLYMFVKINWVVFFQKQVSGLVNAC